MNLSTAANVAGRSAFDPQLVMDRAGTATVVWGQTEGDRFLVLAATKLAGGRFGNPATLADLSAPDPEAVPPSARIAMSPRGDILVAWTRTVPNGREVIQWSTRPPVGAFSLPHRINSLGNAGTLRVTGAGIAPDGSTTIVFTEDNHLQAVTRPPRGHFGAREKVSPSGLQVYSAELSLAPDGTANVLFFGVDKPEYEGGQLLVASRLPGGRFGEPVSLSTGIIHGDRVIASGSGGHATAAWTVGYDSSDVAAASTVPDVSYCERAALRLGRMKTKQRSGAGRLAVTTGALGVVKLKGSTRVRGAVVKGTEGTTTGLVVRARGSAARRLKRNGKVRVPVKIKFRPGLGCSDRVATRRVVLTRRRAK